MSERRKDTKTMSETTTEDVMALAGLRRMVVHSRDLLAATVTEPRWNNSLDAWSAAQVKRYMASQLAVQVLTLVLDCLPGADGISADEAAQREKQWQRKVATAEQALAGLNEQVTTLQAKVVDLEGDRDAAVESQAQAEDEAAAWQEQWHRARELAASDVPAAVRYLESDGEEDADVAVVGSGRPADEQ